MRLTVHKHSVHTVWLVSASQNGKCISHNVSHFKKINSPYTVRNLITLKMMMTRIQLLPDDNAETVPQNESPDPHRYPRGDKTKRMMKELIVVRCNGTMISIVEQVAVECTISTSGYRQ